MLHGSAGDPRYPSTRRLRRALAFVLDLVLHLGSAVGVFFASEHVPSLAHLPTVWAIAAWIVVSFAHRVLIQRLCQTTLGKALFGLCLIRAWDGGRVTLGPLAKAWLLSIWVGIALFGAVGGASVGGDLDEDAVFLPVVRRKDIRAVRRR